MLENNFGKFIILILIVIIFIFALMLYKSNKSHQTFLEQEIQSLKTQVAEQGSTIENNKKHVFEESERQAEVDRLKLNHQQELNKLKEQELDKKLGKIESVITILEQQKSQEKALRSEYEKMSHNALKATYLAQGLQTASMLKVYVAEYTMNEGVFPNTNKQLNLPKPSDYATEAIREIWVSKGGKITVVYTQKTGQNKGAISLVPQLKNNQILWKCTTRDFKNIHQFIPQCVYNSPDKD
jgi:DNA repair exonuclease SbcCD ATPase subunit